MKFCKECGHELKPNAGFCPECGTAVQQSSSTEPEAVQQANGNQPSQQQQPTTAASPQANRPPRKPWTKKQKLIALGAAIAVVLLVIAYQIGATLTDKDRMVEKFGEAILDQDSETIADMISSDDKRLDITGKDVEKLLTYLNDNPSYYSSLMDSLKAQSKAFDEDSEGALFYENEIFTLEKDGKVALFYDDYNIKVTPFYFTVATNMEGAKILLGGEEIATADSDAFEKEYGPVFPGIYELKAEFTNEYTTLDNSYQMELIYPSSQNMYADLPLYGEYITMYADYEGQASTVTYFLNDKEVTLDEDGYLGPISLDGSNTAHAVLEFPWGQVESEKVTVEYNSVDFPVDPLTDTEKDTMKNMIHTFGQDFANAYSELDESKFTNISDSLRDDLANDMEDYERWEEKWVGTYEKVLIDLDSFSFESYDSEYYAYVQATHFYDSAVVSVEDEDYETDETEYDREYEFIYDQEEGKWVINDRYGVFWGVSHDNAEEMVAAE